MTRDEIMAMDEDALRLAVAKVLGYESYWANDVQLRVPDNLKPPEYLVKYIDVTSLPNYPRDIAAAYALEDALPVERRGNFTTNLWMIVGLHERDTFDVSLWQLIHASAADRCRAWLMTTEGVQ